MELTVVITRYTEGGRVGGARERGLRMIYSFRPLPLMKGCRWMTYHLTIHTIMTRFRLGISDIFVHHYRYKRHTYKDLICPLCRVAKETLCSVLPCATKLYSAICKFLLKKIFIKPAAGIHQ